MPNEVERQSERFAMGPHVPDRYWHDDEREESRRQFADEYGLDREPPPEHQLHDPGFTEHEVDPYPHA